ncbi:hypothetical protein SCHPADRAFT_124383 [Schizopora paradoxa]|uniref:Uncharacterized protein n=1 Tax=Schizopora paradoxa TaxID=27342 RepID=A0A0H2S291_9AGAM|nr:hypothetical protein SCHPADRAFT_124383 [Schizopora paradoxa]
MLVVEASISQLPMILFLTRLILSFTFGIMMRISMVKVHGTLCCNEVIRQSISVNVLDATGRCCTGLPFSAERCCSCGESWFVVLKFVPKSSQLPSPISQHTLILFAFPKGGALCESKTYIANDTIVDVCPRRGKVDGLARPVVVCTSTASQLSV